MLNIALWATIKKKPTSILLTIEHVWNTYLHKSLLEDINDHKTILKEIKKYKLY